MEELIEKTTAALKLITTPRYFKTERGFGTEFYKLLSNGIEGSNLFPPLTILEAEVQKRINDHYGISQRPDIIIHIPIETGLTENANENNFVVYAFKLNGNNAAVDADFAKLEEMFQNLNYRMGIFINIGTYPNTHLDRYNGNCHDRIHEFSVALDNGQVLISYSRFVDQNIVTTEK